MPSVDEVEQQQVLLTTYRKTLRVLLEQRAILGPVHAPPSIIIGIADARENIQRIKGVLRNWSVSMDNHVNDVEDETEQKKMALATYRHTLHELLEQQAELQASYIPPYVIGGIVEARYHIRHIKAVLRTKNKDEFVEDHPNDNRKLVNGPANDSWTWYTHGEDVLTDLTKSLKKGLDPLIEHGWLEVDWALASQRYREMLIRQYGWMHIFGMAEPVPLDDIFTDVYLLDKPSAWRRYSIQELQRQTDDEKKSKQSERRTRAVRYVHTQKRLFILGQPGAGKTTFLKYLVGQAVKNSLQGIPIFVSLKAWSDTHIELIPFIEQIFEICNFPDARPFIEKILKDGNAIILFDGLDEVNLENDARRRIINSVRSFAQQYSESRILITCRTAATEHIFEGFSYCELAEFTNAQMQSFVTQWFHDNQVKREAFWKAFGEIENERLRDLGHRPLLLTMLCLAFEETMSFPNRRAELYEEAVDALLKKWDSSRSIQRDSIYRKLSLGYKRQLLTEVAAETFENGKLFMQKQDLAATITAFMKRLPTTEEDGADGEIILKSLESQHGLLVERAQDIYSFSHLTFHEYFAARYIVEHPKITTLKETISHSADRRWHEVLLLVASMLDHVNATRLFITWHENLRENLKSDEYLLSLLQWSLQHAENVKGTTPANARVLIFVFIFVYKIKIFVDNIVAAIGNLFKRAQSLELDTHFIGVIKSIMDDAVYMSAKSNSVLSLLDQRMKSSNLYTVLNSNLNSVRGAASALANSIEIAKNFRLSNTSVVPININFEIYYINVYSCITTISTLLRALTVFEQAFLQSNDLGDRNNFIDFTHLWYKMQFDKNISSLIGNFSSIEIYVSNTMCLVECLGIATVDDRQAILDQIFLPAE